MSAAVIDFSTLQTGTVARFSKQITVEDIRAFAALSGDYNPLHLDPEYARKTSFGKPVAHGVLLASYVSRMVGMQLPGAGALWMRQSFQWPAPVFAGDTVEITMRVTHRSAGSNTITVEVTAVKQDGTTVLSGEGAVLLMEQQPSRPAGRSLRESVAVLSGGTRNGGAAIAFELAREGAAVALSDSTGADEVVAKIKQEGGQAATVRLDSDSLSAVEQTFGKPVHVLVNNTTAAFKPQAFGDLSWETVQQVLDQEIRGVFDACQAALKLMLINKSGCIVNLGSILTKQAPPAQMAPVVLAKSALLGLTRSLATEFGPQGIRVNLISLGMGDFDMADAGADRLKKVQAMQTPLRRLATSDDVAKAVVFLCSDAGSYITGADLPLAGGLSM